ncbi:hypothetical protein [Natrarchaeobius oligotrophus]|uniref:Uncharacterized protein n=1 Tax=Natrarchaeobius chitinivorans TaxID=1679083 RepID=A0A3N6MGY4_NATCH|nr:hypothetical protein [Natrarchaeobius chitinivorans]RQH02318.1 hypothetical protein EA472_03185 [Natrarchaeobius chitinivorans]
MTDAQPPESASEDAHKRITEETQIDISQPLDIDEMFLEAMADTDMLHFEYDEDDDVITRCEIDPRVLRSAMFLYSSMERTPHDWR